MSADTLISPPQALIRSVPSTISAVQAINAGARQILALSVPQSQQVPSLAGDVSNVKSHAQRWLSSVAPRVHQALQGVATWASIFDSLFPQLSSAATRIGQGETSAIAPFQGLLVRLQGQTKVQLGLVQFVQQELSFYLALVDGDVRRLDGDQQQLQMVIQATQGNLTQASQQLQSLEDQLDREQASLGGFPPLDPRLLISRRLINALTGQADGAQQEVEGLQSQVSIADEQLQIASQASSALAAYQSATSGIAGAVGTLLNGWETLNSNLAELTQSEAITTFDVFTPALLTAIRSDWTNLANQARALGGALVRIPSRMVSA